MDEIFDPLFNAVIQAFGIEPAILMGVLALLSMVFRLIGKLIPDNATGYLAVIRKIAKILGLYVGNRVARGISTNDVAYEMAATNKQRFRHVDR